MKYSPEVIEAARVVLDALGYKAAGPQFGQEYEASIPAELMMAAFMQKPKGPTPKDLMELWNTLKDDRLPVCRALTSARMKHARARLAEFPNAQDWKGFIDAINHNPWALGTNPNPAYPNWKADFDWFIRPASILRYMEKGMDGRGAPARAPVENTRDSYREDLDRR